jgi:hypothetical protein
MQLFPYHHNLRKSRQHHQQDNPLNHHLFFIVTVHHPHMICMEKHTVSSLVQIIQNPHQYNHSELSMMAVLDLRVYEKPISIRKLWFGNRNSAIADVLAITANVGRIPLTFMKNVHTISIKEEGRELIWKNYIIFAEVA